MGIKNARIVGIRLDESDSRDLASFEAATSIEGVSLARAALKAALNRWKETGKLSLPLHITDEPAGGKSKAPTVIKGHFPETSSPSTGGDDHGLKATVG